MINTIPTGSALGLFQSHRMNLDVAIKVDKNDESIAIDWPNQSILIKENWGMIKVNADYCTVIIDKNLGQLEINGSFNRYIVSSGNRPVISGLFNFDLQNGEDTQHNPRGRIPIRRVPNPAFSGLLDIDSDAVSESDSGARNPMERSGISNVQPIRSRPYRPGRLGLARLILSPNSQISTQHLQARAGIQNDLITCEDGTLIPVVRLQIPPRPYNPEGFTRFECTICSETCSRAQKMSKLVCNHDFHFTCISKWLVQSGTCPICRAAVTHLTSGFIGGPATSQPPEIQPNRPTFQGSRRPTPQPIIRVYRRRYDSQGVSIHEFTPDEDQPNSQSRAPTAETTNRTFLSQE